MLKALLCNKAGKVLLLREQKPNCMPPTVKNVREKNKLRCQHYFKQLVPSTGLHKNTGTAWLNTGYIHDGLRICL